MQRSQRRSLTLIVAVLLLGALAPGALPAPTAAAAEPAAARTVTRIPTSEKVIALTFDAGSDRGYASRILDTLADTGVKASFGMTGIWAQQNPDLVKRMVADGHQLINHSWDHPDFTQISSAQRADQLQRTRQFIQQLTGYEVRPFFRPPFGAYNDQVLIDLQADGYSYNVMWTVDTLGWQGASVAAITSRTLNAAAPGAIVLMHVGADSQDAAALPGIIDQLRAQGYRFDTVAHLLGVPSQSDSRYFPQTGHWLSHGFLRYWEQFGGLTVFGYPITEEFKDPATGHVTQYFERARFEWQPGAWPARYDVLLGLLGNELSRQRGLTSTAPFQRVSATSDANCSYYPQTGHRLCFGFRAFWESHGGLAIYGYPISEEYREAATGLTVQYFERQRLEWHPENPPAWQVEGGLLGSLSLAAGR
ncbi:MAG TPA: polysaccharide deacetylase family protein [Thermomicrobiaceae bacterium]|nr:polysaccharide deacetylase family protein [Thermomicrobiaceae bacterium]